MYSSASQVIAAIYGLIITGYIFLRNELDRKADKDETLEEVILLLKTEYYGSIIGISVMTIFSISLCFLVIVDETNNNIEALSYLINLSVTTIFTDLIIIVLFVIKILNPTSLELASNRIRDIMTNDKANKTGSLETFLKHYNQIEYILEKYGTSFLYAEDGDHNSVRRRRISKIKLVDILYREQKIESGLKDRLVKLISFRNGLIHSTNLSISIKDVES